MKKALSVSVFLCIALVLVACGRKEPPQLTAETPPPEIASLKHEIVTNNLAFDIRLEGGSEGVGYQIDRAEIDPHCNCPGFWRRYFEQPPSLKVAGENMRKLVSLRGGRVEYAFRLRAVDGLGRLSAWSKTIRAKSAPQ
ncbi:MAG: hypothetical protein ACE5DY_05415 [Mariprofundaceae bacterium]